jgi:hydrophobic/amphiphilic exporter-1 (mainly G- bacteria), HAE1 family
VSVPRFAIQRPVMMSMISAIIILLGGISLSRLPVDLLPDISQPTVNVRVGYAGVGPLEMEELVTRPLEQQLSAISGLAQMNSTSQEGSSSIQLNFSWGHDLNEAMDEIRTRIDRVRSRLPEDSDPPVISKFDPNTMPIMGMALESTDGKLDRVTLRELAEQTLSPRLERVAGVAAVTVSGGLRRQIHVDLSREKITALDLSVDRVVSVLRNENQDIPIGEIYRGDRSFLLRSEGQFQNLDQIKNLVILTKGDVPVYLRDIATVTESTEDVRSLLRINGRPGIRMQVTKQSGTNTVAIAQGVRAEIERINREVPGVQITLLDDSAKFIERAISGLGEHILIGGVLVILIIFAFLRNVRSTLIVCTSIPISVVGTFALLYFSGMTLNTMTFGGIALGVGMIVDASIVVLENSFRHMEHYGKDRMTASIDGSEEVWSAILASILTHIAVFVPLLFLEGISSVMFRQLSIVVAFSLAMSLFVAVTLVPVLCSKMLVLPKPQDQRTGYLGRLYTLSDRALERMDEGYSQWIRKALAHRPAVIGFATASVVVAALIFPTLPTEFTSQTDEGQVSLNVQLPLGTRFEVTEPVLLRLEQSVGQLVPEATSVIVSTGGGGGGGGGFGGGAVNRGQVQILLTPKDERTRSSDQIAQDLRRQLAGMPGVIIRANASGGNQMNRFLSGGNSSSRLSLEIRGEDLATSQQVARSLKDLLDNIPGIADATVGRDEGRPEFAVRVDREKAALLGVSAVTVANTIRTNVAGTQAALFRLGGQEYPIIVRLREDERQNVDDVEDVLISTPSGAVVPAKSLMQIENAVGPTQIQRKNQQRINFVNAEPETTLSEAVQAVNARLPELQRLIPQDFSVGFGAEVEQQDLAFRQLRMMLLLALILVYAVMASQYESLRDPFIIMFSVPTAAIGIVLSLKLTGTAFNMQAYIGIIMLAGIVVSNGILLVDYTNVLRRRDGMPLREAVETAGRTRLRPILMTSIATALGLVPMSLGIGEGSELQVPLARVVIGGLTTSLLITLVLVPTMYTIFEEGVKGIPRRSAGALLRGGRRAVRFVIGKPAPAESDS